jgi:hypothetical protein
LSDVPLLAFSLAVVRVDGFDLYNLFNSNTTTSYDQTFLYSNQGAMWLNPTAILNPRLARFNATLSF